MKLKIIKRSRAVTLIFIISFLVLGFLLLPAIAVAAASQIRITEIMYDPSGNGDREFLEIYNGSDTSVVVGGMTLFGVDYTFPAGSTLSAGQYGVIVRNLAVFKPSHPGIKIFGQYGGKLRGGGELVSVSKDGVAQTSVSYRYGGAWPATPKDGGPSLSLVRTDANESQAACWAASASSGGTPGRANSTSGDGAGCGSVAYPMTVSKPQSSSSNTGSASQNSNGANNNSQDSADPQAGSNASQTEEQTQAHKDQLTKQAAAEAKTTEQASKQIADESAARRNRTKTNSMVALGIFCVIGASAIAYMSYQKTRNHLLAVRLNKPFKEKLHGAKK